MPKGFGIYWFIKRIDLKAEKVCIDLNSSKELQKRMDLMAEKYMYLVLTVLAHRANISKT